MNTVKRFTVKNPSVTHQLSMIVVGLLVALLALYTFIDPQPHPAMYVVTITFVVLPFLGVGVWSKRRYIRVDGMTITVQNGLAVKPFRVNVSEISRVKCVMANTSIGRSFQMTVYAGKGRKFGVETWMIHSEKMVDYINEHVDPMKIETIHKNFAS